MSIWSRIKSTSQQATWSKAHSYSDHVFVLLKDDFEWEVVVEDGKKD